MSNLSNIISNSACLSEKQMLQYLDKKLEREEIYLVEEHLGSCMMCSDALDGLMLLPSNELITDLDDVKRIGKGVLDKHFEHLDEEKEASKKLIAHKGSGHKRKWAAVASLLFFLFGGAIALFSYINLQKKQEGQLASKDGTWTDKAESKESVATSSPELSTIALNPEDLAEKDLSQVIAKQDAETPNPLADPVLETERKMKSDLAKPTEKKEERGTQKNKTVAYDQNSSLANENREAAKVLTKNESESATQTTTAVPAPATSSQTNVYSDKRMKEDLMNTATTPLFGGKQSEADLSNKDIVEQKKNKKLASKGESIAAKTTKSTESLGGNIPVQESTTDNETTIGFKRPQSDFDEAVTSFNTKNYSKAIRLFKKALKDRKNTNQDQIKLYLAQSYLRSGNRKEANILLEELSKNSDYKNEANKLLGR